MSTSLYSPTSPTAVSSCCGGPLSATTNESYISRTPCTTTVADSEGSSLLPTGTNSAVSSNAFKRRTSIPPLACAHDS
ncbi:hypothetical protein GGH92_009778, partial [Coemansia sp. RSA 2673]